MTLSSLLDCDLPLRVVWDASMIQKIYEFYMLYEFSVVLFII